MTGVAAGRRICVIEEVMWEESDIGNIAAISPVWESLKPESCFRIDGRKNVTP